MSITIHHGELDQEDVQALLALHVTAMHAHSPPDACHVLPRSALTHPSITFYSVREDGRLLGIGALKELGDGAGEMKSMRTAPDALGRGVGRQILNFIVAESRRREYKRILLETGTGDSFAAANALYDSAGFVPTEAFGGYPESAFTRFLRLDL